MQSEEGEAYLNEQIGKDADLFFDATESGRFPELDSGQLFEEINKKKKSSVSESISSRRLTTGTGTDVEGVSLKHLGYRHKSTSLRIWRMASLAAAAVFLIVGVMIFNKQYEKPLPEDPAPAQFVETQRGERQTVRLADGTRVILNHESRLSIPGDFSETNRHLVLEGEAWFEVVSLPAHPFTVTSSNSVVRVLGTSFLVESRSEEEKTRVVVADGRVSLAARENGATQEKIIEKNQGGTLEAGREIVLQDIPDPELYIGWKDGKLIFQSTPFMEVISRLERWYDIDCVVTDSSITHEKFTSVFSNEPLLQVLDVIALSMNISYEIDNGTVTFITD